MKITQCEVIDFAKALVFPAVGAITVVVSILGIKTMLDTGIWGFSVCACIAILEYLGVVYLFDNRFNYGIRSLVTTNLKLLKGA